MPTTVAHAGLDSPGGGEVRLCQVRKSLVKKLSKKRVNERVEFYERAILDISAVVIVLLVQSPNCLSTNFCISTS